jgi:hypothetical protein
MDLDERFRKFESSIDALKLVLNSNEQKLAQTIQSKFNTDFQIDQVNKKRSILLNETEASFVHAFKNTLPQEKWIYYENKNDDESYQKLLSVFICHISRLSYANDFEFYKKLRFYNLHRFTQNINLDEKARNFVKVVVLNPHKLLAYDGDANELILMDRKFNRLKTIQIERDFNCFQISKISERIVVNLVTHVKRKTFIYVYDFDLNRKNSKLFKNQFIFFKSSQNMFFFRNSDLQTFYLHFNLDLEMVGKYEIDYKSRKSHGDLNSILNAENRFIFNCRETGEIKILSKVNFELIKAIPVSSYMEIKLFVDTKSNLFVLYKKSEEDQYHLNCYDKDGNFFFSQSPIFIEYFQVFKNYETIYLYDENSVLKSFL